MQNAATPKVQCPTSSSKAFPTGREQECPVLAHHTSHHFADRLYQTVPDRDEIDTTR